MIRDTTGEADVDIRIPGVKLVKGLRKRGSGRLYSYAYHRKTGRRIRAQVGTPAFYAEIRRLNAINDTGRWQRKTQRRSITGTGWIYFIEAQTPRPLVKIGWSKSPTARLGDLIYGSPIAMKLITGLPGSQTEEKDLHARFESLREHGEWFRKEAPLALYLNEILASNGRRPWTK